MIGLYVHVPFCAVKCPYCDFYSVKYSQNAVRDYIDNLKTQINIYHNIPVDTLYFGGGTPSLLSIANLTEIFGLLKNHFIFSLKETTIEVNPNTVTEEKLRSYLELGVNRLSVGVQSLDDADLKFLGRNHTPERALNVISMARKVGFENISADLMIGLPNQNDKVFLENLNKLDVDHISLYMLKIEENTPFYRQNIIIDDDFAADLYLSASEKIEQLGLQQYEISNFGKKSLHNLKYWKCEEYIGLGPSAHSYYNGIRFSDTETDENAGTLAEKAMLGLRLTDGFDFEDLAIAEKYQKPGCVNINGKNVSLTKKGFLISNKIIGDLTDSLDLKK